ncbi:MAG: hypothetical protein KOO60_03675 [Gemmatimonadales bacterium]|nr:hypothetical protein [Gemmatimonadales bacterium]
MKFKHVFFLTYVAIIIVGCGCALSEKNIPPLQDQYLGQKPPGDNPEVFAPGFVSDESWAEHCQVAVSPNGDEIFWSAWTGAYKTEDGEKNTEQIFYSKFEKGTWAEPQLAEFTKENPYGLNGGPVYSLDGKKLFFYQVKSPWVSSTMNTYFVEKTNGTWSDQPIDAGQPYNSQDQNYSPVFTRLGNAYKNAGGITSKFTYNDAKFALVDTLVIHKDFRPAWNIYVSPMEDYVIFAAMHEGGYGDIDLYVSFKTQDNKWGTPKNLGNKINTETRERFPTVSPDGKYLFFMRHTETQDFFWVSTDILEELRE